MLPIAVTYSLASRNLSVPPRTTLVCLSSVQCLRMWEIDDFTASIACIVSLSELPLQITTCAEAINDINIVAGCLKLWFRELPEPLLTHELYHGFIEAAKIGNYRLRHIRLHEQVNELPDPNYATLKALMKHLDA